ncbi:MAG: 50S ribosomal protein L11 methyltransferase [Acidobacteriota bacterium]
MYSLPDYGRMLAEPSRFGAYRRALERAVKPGDVVIDLGAGPGVFALLAARAGADTVYAIEPDPVVALVGELAAANGLGGIEPVASLSTAFTPPRKADVLVSDLRGVLPTFTEHLPSIIDARKRLLKPGGALIPRRDVLVAAPVSAPDARRRHFGGFDVEGLDLSAATDRVCHLWARVELPIEALAAEPAPVAVLEYAELDSPHVKGAASFTVDGRDIDGFAVWFDAELDDAERFTNAPSSPLIYGQAFFPVEAPLETRSGDRLHLRFAAHQTPGDDYLYRWRGELERGSRRLARFDHSTFNATFADASALQSRRPEHRPELAEDARTDHWVLGRLLAGAALGEVAAELAEREPRRHADAHRALRTVSRVADRYAVHR